MNQEALIAAIASDNAIPEAAVAAYVDNIGVDDPDTLADDVLEAFQGEYDDLADYAYQTAEAMGTVPDSSAWPLMHIDWKAAGRDLEIGGDVWTDDRAPGGIYVFVNY